MTTPVCRASSPRPRAACAGFAALLAGALPCVGVTTETARHAGFESFLAGERENLSIDHLGNLSLAPQVKEVATLPDPVVAEAIAGEDGGLVLGAGESGAVYRLSAEGELETLFEPEEVLSRALERARDGALFVGTSPKGRVYRIPPDGGRPEVFFDPGDRYIWALRVDAEGAIYVATGQKARIYKLDADHRLGDEATVWFESDQTHLSRMAFAANGDLLAGASPGAYLYRIRGKGEAKALYKAKATEISAIEPLADGGFYFAAVGEASNGATNGAGTGGETRADARGNGEQPEGGRVSPADLPKLLEQLQDGKDGSAARGFVYRGEADGFIEPFWTPGEGRVFSVAERSGDELLVGTDTGGALFSVRDRQTWSLLRELPNGGQVSALVRGSGDAGKLYAVTSNPAAVYAIGNAPAKEGRFRSKVVDAGGTARWGALRPVGRTPDSLRGIAWSTRSGNTERPGDGWSDWTPLEDMEIASPQARYLQYRARFTERGAALRQTRVFYQRRNRAPVVGRVRLAPIGVRPIELPSKNHGNVDWKTLLSNADEVTRATRSPVRRRFRVLPGTGLITIVWRAYDPNGDDLRYRVALRGEGEPDWVELATDLEARAYSIDTEGFEDGHYQVRVTATDHLANAPGDARTGYRHSRSFLVDNTPPKVRFEGTRAEQDAVVATFRASDAFSVVTSAEYRLDGEVARQAMPADGIHDASDETFELRLEDLDPGQHSLVLTVRDEAGNAGGAKAVFEAKGP